jgi:hypothetical protein
MGHTVSSQRRVVDSIMEEFREYKKSLRSEDFAACDKALDKVKLHIGSISYAASYNTWALVLFSIILEQEKELMRHESHINGLVQGRGQDSALAKRQ